MVPVRMTGFLYFVHTLLLYITGDPYKQTKFPKHRLFGLCLYFGIVNNYKPILADPVYKNRAFWTLSIFRYCKQLETHKADIVSETLALLVM
jgi:hypothetical protein